MVTRLAFMAQCKNGMKEQVLSSIEENGARIKQFADQNSITVLSMFEQGDYLFLYYECTDRLIEPMELLIGLEFYLESFPGEKMPRFFVPMYDIFHYNRPLSKEQWKRKQSRTPHAQVLRIKPDMVSSYIFHHYQLQEERPGCGDKYGAIYLHENLMFFYEETPEILEPAPEGKLNTHNSPDNWQEVMGEHFLPWENGELWRSINLILVLNYDNTNI